LLQGGVALSLEILKQQLKSGKFANLYIIYGDEDYLKSFYYKKLTEKAVSGYEAFNLQLFDGGSMDLAQLAAAVNNLPLMSDYKCVVVKDVEPDGMRAGDWKELQGIIKTVPQECILVFYFDAVKPNPKKDARFKSLLATAQKNGLAVEIGKPPRRDAIKFVVKRANSNGCEIDEETADYLIETCGADFNTLAAETDKISAYAGGAKITKDSIDAAAVKPVAASIYDLAKAVTAGRIDIGMNILNDLFYQKEEPVIILSALSGAFCDLYRAKAAALSGANEARVAADFNYRGREFRVRNALRDCRGTDIACLSDCLSVLLKADERIKSTSAPKRVVLEQLIVEIGLASRPQK
jgi:DNA polymerase-3 subunit delta